MRYLTCILLAEILIGAFAYGVPQYGYGTGGYGKPVVIVKDPVSVDRFKARAEAVLVSSGKGGNVQGTITFSENDEGVLILGKITGLQPGQHGFHVHMEGNLADGCLAAGSHYNPFNSNHGSINDDVRHVGDLGNIITSDSGETNVRIFDRKIRIDGTILRNVVGRAIVVHEKVDDLGLGGNEDSLKTGNAGARLACGVINLV